MRRASLVSVLFLLTVPLWSQEVADANAPGPRIVDEKGHVIQLYLEKDHPAHKAPQARTQNLINHGGPIMSNPDVISIFWGAKWGSDPTHQQVMSNILAFFANFGSTGEWNTIKQYGVTSPASLTNQDWLDTSEPPNPGVTDAQIQGEVSKYIDQGGQFDNHTVYEVFLPSNHYAVIGTATSCGGPHLQFCAYHSNYTHNGLDIKYSSMPYPSCSGCQTSGWGDALNFNHFACHETREAATDPDGTAWYDRSGNEADDKCAWNPTPFTDAGFGYQYEWSNADSKCVKTK